MLEEIRSKIVTFHESGFSNSEILKRLKNDKVNPMLIYRTIKRYIETGSVSDRKRIGRPGSARTPALKNSVRCRILRNPRRSMQKMSREFCVNHETMRKLVVEDLGMKSYKRKNVHHLNDSIRHQILFSNEKLFTVEEVSNRQNDRILASRSQDVPDSIKYIDRVQKPLSLIVWAGVSAGSRTHLIFVPQGVKTNSQTHRELVLEPEIASAGEKLFQNHPWTYQQDSAPAHASKVSQGWFREQDRFHKDEWPPSSPDLNPLDYSVWANLESKACEKSHKSLESLKVSLLSEWQKIPQEELRKAVHQFWGRLTSVIHKTGGYIE
ncbi:Transposase [Oopsacas minuta]|uniref:Transposase n=1 Tax=Oopsacas minuta TaxID=111878 RepID=A0AAV7JRT8_9METZ|nr:Transposase [Oopsacas minuta]